MIENTNSSLASDEEGTADNVDEVGAADSADASASRIDLGLLAVAAAFLLPVAFSPETYDRFWAPKAAVCLLLIIPGLTALARLVRSGSRAAGAAALFVGAAGASTLLSDNPILSLTGAANWGTGLLFVAALAGAWALGSVISESRRRQVIVAIIVAAVVNGVVAWLQARGLVPPPLESPGRSGGLMGNPVHLGALAAGALWLVGERIGRDRGSVFWLPAVVVIASAAQLSGGRSAAGLASLAVLAAARRAGLGSWPGRARATAFVAAALLGFVLGPLGATGATLGSTRALGAESTQEVGLRVDLWLTGLDAALERPVVGWGPGRFEAAVSPRSTPEITAGGVGTWKDAHNWVVEYGVTTGGVGLVLLGTWLILAGRASSGPLAGFALIVGLFTLVEPQTVGLTPVALLALGVANRERQEVTAPRRSAGLRVRHVLGLLGGAVSVAAAAVLLIGQVFLYHAFLDTSVRSFNKANALLPPWPEVAHLGSRTEAFYGLHSEPHARRSLALAREAVRRDPADAAAWSYLGYIERKWGSRSASVAAFDRSLQRNPWLLGGLQGRALLAEDLGDDEALAESCRRMRVLESRPMQICRPASPQSVPEN